MKRIIEKFQSLKWDLLDKYYIFMGYMDDDHAPIKCRWCKSKELEDCNEDWLDGRCIRLEFDCRCKKCGKILNHWAYGYWNR